MYLKTKFFITSRKLFQSDQNTYIEREKKFDRKSSYPRVIKCFLCLCAHRDVNYGDTKFKLKDTHYILRSSLTM